MDADGNERRTADRSERELQELRLPLRTLLEGLPDAVVAATGDGRIVFVNSLAEELFGYPRDELLGQQVAALWPHRLRQRYMHNMKRYFDTEHPMRFSTEAWGLRQDGTEFVGEMSWGIVATTAGSLLLAIGRDISERRRRETRLRGVAEMGERALSGAGPLELADVATEVLRTTLPVRGAEVLLSGGFPLASFGSVEDAAVRVPIGTGDELVIAPERELGGEELMLVRAVANTLAAALERLRDEERLRHEALHDPLTGLANRTLLRDRLEHALARSQRQAGATAVLFIDLDGFKHVNDVHGHAVGDSVLAVLATRLQTAVRPGDTIARVGGDEFVVICEDVDEKAAVRVGRRLHDAIRLPLTAGEVEQRISASIGIALGLEDPDTLLEHADSASYAAKAAGGGGLEVFT
jgi:diguanylate cyclase (GGDEF)-like protein/PAS domain S-box-containing protein